jgi:hypothetical protein
MILFSACATANINQVDILLKCCTSGISIHAGELSNAIVHAATSGHLSVIDRLLRESSDINALVSHANGSSRDKTALQAAVGGGHLAVFERLLQEKAVVNAAASRSGMTAL